MTSVLSPAVAMPEWLQETEAANLGNRFPTPEDQIRFTIRLAGENVRRDTGGPFAAAIFDRAGILCATGINRVLPARLSFAHAEMMAIGNMQHKTASICLEGFVLAASCEPCVMCFGGTLWARVDMLLYGAPGSCAAAIGFDEGDKVADWRGSLKKRHIEVVGPLLAEEANAPFELYEKLRRKIY